VVGLERNGCFRDAAFVQEMAHLLDGISRLDLVA
jgi:hypothetical protein